jgi:plasmid stability protein
MRTTMNLDDDLYRRAKALAAARGCSVTSVVEDALRTALLQRDQPTEFRGLPVSTQLGGLLPGIDLDDSRSLQAVLDDGTRIDALR